MLEASYDPVPGSWYASVGIAMLIAAIYVITFYPMQLPIYGLFLAVLIALVFLPACGIIAATTGTVIGLNVITEFVAGFLLPGKPIANVTFKVPTSLYQLRAFWLVLTDNPLISDSALDTWCKSFCSMIRITVLKGSCYQHVTSFSAGV